MVKQGTEKQNFKSHSINKLNDSKLNQNFNENKISKKSNKNKDSTLSFKSEFIKKECIVQDIENVENYSLFDKSPENIETLNEKIKLKKKCPLKSIKEPDEKKMELSSDCGQVKLSQTVIVNSVLKSTKIDCKTEAILPEPLEAIYNKFVNSRRYIESLHSKDEFFCGIGLLGVNIEEKIYTKRKALEESLKRGIRLRPNPKPTKLFDGTVINRPARNNNAANKLTKSTSRPIVLRGKTKYNLFNIGIDATKKKNRRVIRKPIKKKQTKSDPPKKETDTPNSGSSDDEPDESIASTRPKRQQKVPQIDFKYCYADRINARKAKNGDSNSDDGRSVENGQEFMEIVDSDSSSVVEVSPPNNIDLSDDLSDGPQSKCRETDKSRRSKCQVNMRRGWRPKESKALNLLDKLRLGLQCTIIQTEHDIIIQNLSLEDLATLQSRLHGLATFKNIEAEYDKNGQETARATIDRKLLNLPLKTANTTLLGDSGHVDLKSAASIRKYDESLKRKSLSSQLAKLHQTDRKKIALHDKSADDLTKSSKNHQTGGIANYKSDDISSVWMRPKGRSVKKVRKLYTQSGSTPNILSRSQMANRSDNLMTSSARTASNQSLSVSKNQGPLSFSQSSIVDNNQHSTSVSFYSQLSTIASSITSIPLIAKPVTCDLVKAVSTITSTTSVSVAVISTDSEPSTSQPTDSATISSPVPVVTTSDTPNKPITVEKIVASSRLVDLVSPATAMSASQLMMLKRGGGHTSTEVGTVPTSVVTVVNSTDQLYPNQILKPFKKTLVTSSPPKLELDDEDADADFELTPSMITQVKNVSLPINLSSSPIHIQSKNNFLTKPLIQSSGILSSARRTISITNTPLFQAQNAIINPTGQMSTCTVTMATKHLTIADKPVITVVTAQSIALPITGVTSTAHTNISNVNIVNNNNSQMQNTSPNQNINVKIKPRKWTHNFHTSNTINFREILGSSRSTSSLLPILSSQIQLPITNSANQLMCTNAAKQQIAIPATITNSSIANPLRTPDKLIQTPSKGSSAVLKSLLVGSNSTNDLCNLNKTANWATKYLSSTSSLQDSSKIKWQVGGTVVASLPSLMSPPISKETSTTLEVAITTNNK